jgi:D-alanine-D-alanine ligase
VILLFGGRSAEHEISILSARAVYDHLDPDRHPVSCLYINRRGEWRKVDSPHVPAEQLNEGPFHGFLPWETTSPAALSLRGDIYFPILHGPFGEDGTIQGLFEMAGVPYVGASVLASAAGMDKVIAKTLFSAAGLPVGPYRVVREPEWKSRPDKVKKRLLDSLRLPIFVKPANLGSSIGITMVKDPALLADAVDRAFRYGRKIIVEQGIEGREIECSVLGDDAARASLPGEILPSREFYDYRDKYLDGKTGVGIPAALPRETIEKIQALAVDAFRVIDGSGMARVDFFIEKETGEIFINELNTIPGFTEISMYPKLWQASGLTFADLLIELIDLALARHRRGLGYQTEPET